MNLDQINELHERAMSLPPGRGHRPYVAQAISGGVGVAAEAAVLIAPRVDGEPMLPYSASLRWARRGLRTKPPTPRPRRSGSPT